MRELESDFAGRQPGSCCSGGMLPGEHPWQDWNLCSASSHLALWTVAHFVAVHSAPVGTALLLGGTDPSSCCTAPRITLLLWAAAASSA